MSVKCTISKRGSGVSQDQLPHFHLKPVYKTTISIDQLAKRISDTCTLSQPDVIACLSALNLEVKDQLQQGNRIDLGWLGTFKLAIETQSHTDPSKCSPKDIKRVKVNYQLNKNLKHELNNLTRFKIDPEAKLKYGDDSAL